MTVTTSAEATGRRVRIPADVDRPDQILGRLTARQLLLLAPAVVLAVVLARAGAAFGLPLPLVVTVCMPPLAVGLVLAVTGRDGLSLDRYVAAAWAYRRTPKLHLPPVGPTPGWLPEVGAAGRGGAVPARPLARQVDRAGVVDLGPDGVAVLAAVDGLPATSLASEGDRARRLAAMAGMLDGLSGPIQITVRTVPAGLTPLISRPRAGAPGLAHPALAAAATAHADYLSGLAARRAPLAREILLTAHEPVSGGGPARQVAAGRALARLDDAAGRLAPAGLAVRVLTGEHVARVLAAAAHPTGPPPPPGTQPAVTSPSPTGRGRADTAGLIGVTPAVTRSADARRHRPAGEPGPDRRTAGDRRRAGDRRPGRAGRRGGRR
jgi:PrgI family protein